LCRDHFSYLNHYHPIGKETEMLYDSNQALIQSEIKDVKLLNRGKVRDIYDLGDSLLFIATDRISAFDVVMANGIPLKGKVLTQISLFWFELMNWMPNHLITADVSTRPELLPYVKDLQGRAMIVKKAQPLPVECIVRGYLVGSGWKDYLKDGIVSGINLPSGYKQAEKLDQPLFTPSTKAEMGMHDEAISLGGVEKLLGKDIADQLSSLSLKIYKTAADYAETKGIILADTKFEFGIHEDKVILIDEVLTPDSSRFWPADQYKTGCNPPSLDKQFVRDYLETLDWNKTAPGPELPHDIVAKTTEKYLEAYKVLTGKNLV
jgi:phosphoribosylaminoimidazole-succinocarboxamide synthase